MNHLICRARYSIDWLIDFSHSAPGRQDVDDRGQAVPPPQRGRLAEQQPPAVRHRRAREGRLARDPPGGAGPAQRDHHQGRL